MTFKQTEIAKKLSTLYIEYGQLARGMGPEDTFFTPRYLSDVEKDIFNCEVEYALCSKVNFEETRWESIKNKVPEILHKITFLSIFIFAGYILLSAGYFYSKFGLIATGFIQLINYLIAMYNFKIEGNNQIFISRKWFRISSKSYEKADIITSERLQRFQDKKAR